MSMRHHLAPAWTYPTAKKFFGFIHGPSKPWPPNYSAYPTLFGMCSPLLPVTKHKVQRLGPHLIFFHYAPYEPKMVAHICFMVRIYLELQLKSLLKQLKVLKRVRLGVDLCFRL